MDGSGIVDVGLRNPKDKLHGLAQVDFIDARALVEGPVFSTGWKFAVAGRRSYVDLWLKPVLEAAGAGVILDEGCAAIELLDQGVHVELEAERVYRRVVGNAFDQVGERVLAVAAAFAKRLAGVFARHGEGALGQVGFRLCLAGFGVAGQFVEEIVHFLLLGDGPFGRRFGGPRRCR